MREKIIQLLGEIEQTEGIRILYACESGSRAWGFPSADSDYDVRFLYVHPLEWYLSIEEHRDVTEYPVQEQLDINGWDLRKALSLYRKSNPPLMEWLGSPIIYREQGNAAKSLRRLAATYYSPKVCIYHYLHMAKGNFREYLKGEQVWIKKYFYVLRPILAINWIERRKGVVPTEFGVLVNELGLDPVLRMEIEKLLRAKQQGAELDYGPRISPISDFIEKELSRLESSPFNSEKHNVSGEQLDDFFRGTLKEVWPNSKPA